MHPEAQLGCKVCVGLYRHLGREWAANEQRKQLGAIRKGQGGFGTHRSLQMFGPNIRVATQGDQEVANAMESVVFKDGVGKVRVQR